MSINSKASFSFGLIIGIVVLVVLGLFVVGAYFGKGNSGISETNSVYEFTISGYEYNPKSLNVDFGETVTLKITNNDNVTHGINLPVFGVKEFVASGATQTVTFVANQRGNPELFCSSDHGEKLLINVI